MDWKEIALLPWQPVATLATGLMAVTGAYRIGKRQIEISREQADTALYAQRANLFDRRFAVYLYIKRFISKSLSLRGDAYVDHFMQPEFEEALEKVGLLFPPAVQTSVRDILSEVSKLAGLRETVSGLPSEKRAASREQIRWHHGNISNAVMELAETMAAQMRLYL